MNDTEKMTAVGAAASKAAAAAPARVRRTLAIPIGPGAIVATAAVIVALCSALACAYLHGEVVSLRAELGAARVAARASERAADRASLAAENARAALQTANADGDTPAPPDPDR